MAARVYITGAAGSGTSSLGRVLADRLGVPHLDTDAFFWAPTDPPYTVRRPVEERVALIAAAQLGEGADGGWVLSGAADGWGELVIDGADLIVFLVTPTPLRLARIRRREAEKFGARVKPGGDMHHNHTEFLKWAASYDEPYFSGRSLTRHRDWLAGRSEPVLELSGAKPVSELVAACWQRLRALNLA
ncbi:adenylate kinase [Sinirhodobacter ferrireducens]|uniref:Adenylate kinase n=1 Tax=Paenirhodobacter ferrireducens TaxID=1215032 RepID=A0A443LV05_9RHOB|nr:adenylate kinase [Sinirhodobacter ferrireducens]RWR53037.1 adenylate kinase [Sinirhodobacter ferrireducens]